MLAVEEDPEGTVSVKSSFVPVPLNATV